VNKSSWGDQTEFFFKLSPELVLAAAEKLKLVCTGRCMALNSYENRVYEIELDLEGPPISRRRVAKFYRPGRWSKEQILEEHEFLLDLLENEIPVVAPIRLEGQTLHKDAETGLWYAIFPKVGGRIPDEMDPDQLRWVGRLLGRIHSVGAAKKAPTRIFLTPATYGTANLEYLLKNRWIPENLQDRYERCARDIIVKAAPLFENFETIRIHGDCHKGNLLWNEGPFFLDFDDMVSGPPVQDFWLLLSSSGEEGRAELSHMLEGYEEMREFERSGLKLIEYLRALRFIHYTAWLARRWEDPAFPRAFPNFNTRQYWEEKTRDLEEQLEMVS
jgi:Ser/Thr protein kinase RdoA (MazF antagonist)